MRDPHVTRLHYTVGTGEGLSYASPPQVVHSNLLGEFSLANSRLIFTPTEHFASEEEARSAVAPFLRAWELQADLGGNIGTIRFHYEHADLIDRNPPGPGENVVILARGASVLVVTGDATLHLTMNKYPDPPSTFRVTPEVDLAYRRWLSFRGGKEPLLSMAYFVLTVMAAAAGGRHKASVTFGIEETVLSTLGRLSSLKGDADTARKMKPGKPLQPLSNQEEVWVERVVRLLILRLGEHAAGQTGAIIRMADLPPI